MDMASAYGAGDCTFDSCRDRAVWLAMATASDEARPKSHQRVSAA